MAILQPHTPFTFRERPSPVPGDLRIAWRFAFNLLILNKSRSKRSSLARLYIMNDAARSSNDADLLGDILIGAADSSRWRIKVEPALGRALDLMVGESLLHWTTVSNRVGVELSATGRSLVEEIDGDEEIMAQEKQRIRALSAKLTEARVTEFLTVKADHDVFDF
ncbi:hypothetical protein [Agrobacterium vitis]|uniref:hypothetical protein n=1 Tax=Agrobacterium vitis TaxID=373 RepID=UPI0012E73E17|nr:hypothetical protein [Agrobacterium vitis]MUZ65496.1 hypothetical protein [Agrobacterium vitis]